MRTKRVSRIGSGETQMLNLYGHGNREGHKIDAITGNYEQNQTSGVRNFVTTQNSLDEAQTGHLEFPNTSRRHTSIDGVLYRAM